MKGGVLSNKVAFCEQQIGELGPWGGSVTLEVTDPCKDLWPRACVRWEELGKVSFWQMQGGWKPEDQPGGQGHHPAGEVSWCQRQRNGKRQDLQVRVTEAAPQRSGTKFGDSLRQNRQQRTGGSGGTNEVRWGHTPRERAGQNTGRRGEGQGWRRLPEFKPRGRCSCVSHVATGESLTVSEPQCPLL